MANMLFTDLEICLGVVEIIIATLFKAPCSVAAVTSNIHIPTLARIKEVYIKA